MPDGSKHFMGKPTFSQHVFHVVHRTLLQGGQVHGKPTQQRLFRVILRNGRKGGKLLPGSKLGWVEKELWKRDAIRVIFHLEAHFESSAIKSVNTVKRLEVSRG